MSVAIYGAETDRRRTSDLSNHAGVLGSVAGAARTLLVDGDVNLLSGGDESDVGEGVHCGLDW